MTLRRTHEFRVQRRNPGVGYLVTGHRVAINTLEDFGSLVRMGPGLQVDSASQDDRQFRGVEIRIAGTAANNTTGNARVYRVTPYADLRASGSKGDAAVELLGTIDFTLGSGTGAAADNTPDQIGTGTRFADIIAWTPATAVSSPKGISDLVSGLYANGTSVQTYSPDDNTCAVLGIPDIGGGDLFIDFSTPINTFALVKLWT